MPSHVRRNVALWRYPDEAGSWHGLVPPMPHYCGLHEGNLTRAQVQALRAHHETSFIEAAVGGGASASIPGLDAILELGMKIALGAITDPFMEEVKDHFGQAGAAQTEYNNQETVPKATVQMTAPAVTYNVTNLITDAVTSHVTAAVEHSLVEEVGPDIAHAVSPGLSSKLQSDVAPVVSEATEKSIATVAPMLLSRALPLHLTRSLTKSITHALVPTLTIALTHNAHQVRPAAGPLRACFGKGEGGRMLVLVLGGGTHFSDSIARAPAAHMVPLLLLQASVLQLLPRLAAEPVLHQLLRHILCGALREGRSRAAGGFL